MGSVWSWEASPSGMAIRYLAFFLLEICHQAAWNACTLDAFLHLPKCLIPR